MRVQKFSPSFALDLRSVDASLRFLDARLRFLDARLRFLDARPRSVDARPRSVDASLRFLDGRLRSVDASLRSESRQQEHFSLELCCVAQVPRALDRHIERGTGVIDTSFVGPLRVQCASECIHLDQEFKNARPSEKSA